MARAKSGGGGGAGLKRVSSMDLCGAKAVQEEMEDIVEK